MKVPSRYSFVVKILRDGHRRWWAKNVAKLEARVDQAIDPRTGRVCWRSRCAMCGGLEWEKDVVIDHRDPMIPVAGFDNWDGVITRMFCEPNGYQVLHEACHAQKTRGENEERKVNRKQAS